MTMYHHHQIVFLVVLLVGMLSLSMAVMPQSQVDVYSRTADDDAETGAAATTTTTKSTVTTTFLASNALYGPWAAMVGTDQQHQYPLVHVTEEDTPDIGLCGDENDDESTSTTTIPGLQGAIVLVPRGNCTYQQKTLIAQQNGAKGVIVYNNLASRYGYNATTLQVSWPISKLDYDCANGMAYIPMDELGFWSSNSNSTRNLDPQQQQPYTRELDALLSGGNDSDLCHKYANDDYFRHCASKRCFLTGNTSTTITATTTTGDQITDKWQACCAWDKHMYLFRDSELSQKEDSVEITIPTVMLTMQQGHDLLDQWKTTTNNSNTPLYVSISSRWKLSFNLSALLIWMLGVTVCAVASYQSAADYHQAIARRRTTEQKRGDRRGGRSGPSTSPPPLPIQRSALQEETLELEPIHAIGFIIMASSSLIVLFYFKIYGIVKVFYAFGCSNAVIQILLVPKVERLWQFLRLDKKWIYRAQGEDPIIPDITNIDLCSIILGYAWGGLWLYQAFTLPHNTTTTFFWVTQNIFGACMCCLFLQIIQLNAMQVASILLVVAFFYDIFFVFVTPYLTKGGESIMITVATSGGPPTADELWCEKYPSDPNCQGGDPLPMLLTMPRFFDYEGGASLLGLGDIVLPGLLVSFAARLDAAKALVVIAANSRSSDADRSGDPLAGAAPIPSSYTPKGSTTVGYYGPVVVAYGVGLFLANAAVYLMHMGQPALLYLVPCCLGTMMVLGYCRSELDQLWNGPFVLQEADAIAYGTRTPHTGSGGVGDGADNGLAATSTTPLGTPDGAAGIMVELSFQQQSSSSLAADEDDEMGRVPLLGSLTASPSLGNNNNNHSGSS